MTSPKTLPLCPKKIFIRPAGAGHSPRVMLIESSQFLPDQTLLDRYFGCKNSDISMQNIFLIDEVLQKLFLAYFLIHFHCTKIGPGSIMLSHCLAKRFLGTFNSF